MSALTLTLAFVFGTAIGSFLNVVILRYQTGRGLSGRSMCQSCSHELSWKDLIPIVSFIALRRRCRYCRGAVSWQYPFVEGLTGILFVLVLAKALPVLSTGAFIEMLVLLFVASLLVVIGVYDAKHTIIPDIPVYVLITVSLAQLFFSGASFVMPTLSALLAGPLVATPLALFWLVSNGRWMGLGDAKLALALGWLLGLSGAVAMFVLAFWIGAAVSLLRIALARVVHDVQLFGMSGRLTMKSEVAFGPFLIAAYLLTWFFGLDVTVLLAL